MHDKILLFMATVLGVAVRLAEISQPFIDQWSWRQSDVAMIAANFYNNGFNIFYPQVDWAGNSAGYVGTEFPLVPFIASLLYLVFGIHEWIGRSVSVFFFAVSVPFLYLLVKQTANQRSALFAIAIYALTPLSIFSGRSFMPDMAALSFSLMALYFFAAALERPRHAAATRLRSAGVAAGLAILVKLPAILIGLPLLYMAWRESGWRSLLRKQLWAFAALALIPPLSWYAHAYLISVTYPPHHVFGSGGIGLESLTTYVHVLREAAAAGLTPLISVTMLVGIFLSTTSKHGQVFHWWLFAILLFAFIAAPGHYRHAWYLLPVTAVAAAFAGRACDFVLSKIAPRGGSKVVALFSVMMLAALSYSSLAYAKPLYAPSGISLLIAGVELNRVAEPDALAAVVDGGDPTCLYYSKRKGWHFLEDFGSIPATSEDAISALEQLRGRGARYFVIPRHSLWWLVHFPEFRRHLDARYRRVRDTNDVVIFDIAAIVATGSPFPVSPLPAPPAKII